VNVKMTCEVLSAGVEYLEAGFGVVKMTYEEEKQARLKRQYSKQAIALAMQGRWKEAVVVNKRLLEDFPSDVDAYNRLGRAYMELGNYAQSKEAYSKSLELDPYNVIAKKNLRRLLHLSENSSVSEGVASRVEPQQFIEETGKAGVVNLENLARGEVLARLVAGDKVYLKIGGLDLWVTNEMGEPIGRVLPKDGQRLVRLIRGGNEYSASVVSASEDKVTVIIREVYQHPSQIGQLSFPSKGLESPRSYATDRIIRREIEYEDEEVEEPGYTIVSSEDIEVVPVETDTEEQREV